MENVLDNSSQEQRIHFKDKAGRFFRRISRALRNRTFLYIVRRTLSSLFTLFLLVAVVTALLRLLPDTKFYDTKEFRVIAGKAGQDAAERWRDSQLYLAGRIELDGTRTSVLGTIFRYIYWILPIPKAVPVQWNSSYTTAMTYHIAVSYFGRAQSVIGVPFIFDLFVDHVGISFRISIITTLIAYVLSVPLGIAMAKRPGGTIDKIGNVFIVLNYAIPALVFYLLMCNLFGDANGIFAWGNFGTVYHDDRWWSLVPPIFCVTFLSIPGIAIWVRRFMVDELSSDYVKFARSKGLSENRIMYTHVLRNASVPLIRGLPSIFLGAIIGSYYIEYIWSIPGTGRLLINALQGSSPDCQLVQALTVIYAALSMASFLLGDIITIFFDPRIKLIAE